MSRVDTLYIMWYIHDMMADELTVTDNEEQAEKNLFEPLVGDAQRVLQHAMLLSSNVKLRVSVAQDVLDRAGHAKVLDSKPMTPIIITNSQVAIMSGVAKEVEDAMAIKGE